MLYNSMSGDASAGTSSYTMLGGSLTAAGRPAFYVTNTHAVIMIARHARIRTTSGVLLRADNAGTGSGNTGAGTAILTLSNETLTGNLITAGTGTITATLENHTTLTGTIRTAALDFDPTSTWKPTGNSTLTALTGAKISTRHGHQHHRQRPHRHIQLEPRRQQKPPEEDLQARRRRNPQASLTHGSNNAPPMHPCLAHLATIHERRLSRADRDDAGINRTSFPSVPPTHLQFSSAKATRNPDSICSPSSVAQQRMRGSLPCAVANARQHCWRA